MHFKDTEQWDIEGIKTEVLHLTNGDNYGKQCLIFFPGNPGLIGYYSEFLNAIHEGLNQNMDIVGCSYAGHTSFSNQIFGLEEELEHKAAFLRHLKLFYPTDTKFYLSGHSLGTFLSKEILKYDGLMEFEKIIALFPVLYGMKETPNGPFLQVISHPFSRHFVANLVGFLAFIHTSLLLFVVKSVTDLSDHLANETVKHLGNRNSVRSVLYLGRTELKHIKDLDVDTLKKHQSKWIMYFGSSDKWVPLPYYETLKREFPEAKTILCQDSIKHDFVNGQSLTMAVKMIDWLENSYTLRDG